MPVILHWTHEETKGVPQEFHLEDLLSVVLMIKKPG